MHTNRKRRRRRWENFERIHLYLGYPWRFFNWLIILALLMVPILLVLQLLGLYPE